MDRILRATAGDGFVKMSAVTARDTVQRANEIHGCTPTAAAALGRTLCAASILGNLLKEENGSLTVRVNGGGPIGSVIAVSDSSGNVRGYVTDPSVELPLRPDGKLDVGGAVGKSGMVTVSRDIGLREPYIGSTELVSGEIAEDITAYMLESEQIPSACGLGVLIDVDRSVKAAGGFIVQLMPGAPEALIDTLEDNIFLMDQLTTILDEDGLEEVFAQVLKGLPYHFVGEDAVSYRCSCSRERVAEAVMGVGRDELMSMIAEGSCTEVSCQFCDAVYKFSPADLQDLLDE
ncbi:MAG: Hsp33 family molecular chaperone HslO [Oscillospiraceae bacterium]|nr:Hsp33 family molecular chaperone HslO [Oscillospiraceae bacterium]